MYDCTCRGDGGGRPWHRRHQRLGAEQALDVRDFGPQWPGKQPMARAAFDAARIILAVDRC
jgi:hypothetical protein